MRMALALGILAGTAAPAMAASNPYQLDYLGAASSHTLAAQETLTQYGFDGGEGLPTHDLMVGYGLSDELTGFAALSLGGQAPQPLGYDAWAAGVFYAPRLTAGGWTPALQLDYQGGLEQVASGRLVASYDRVADALFGGRRDRLSFTANLIGRYEDGGLTPAYALAASYPILSGGDAAPVNVFELQRFASSPLRAGVEAEGDLAGGGVHYVMPAVYATVAEGWQLALGAGFRVAGEGRPVVARANLQAQF